MIDATPLELVFVIWAFTPKCPYPRPEHCDPPPQQRWHSSPHHGCNLRRWRR